LVAVAIARSCATAAHRGLRARAPDEALGAEQAGTQRVSVPATHRSSRLAACTSIQRGS
jgi:hypothetical protein